MTKPLSQLTKKELLSQIKDISEIKSENKIIHLALEDYLRRLAGQELRSIRGKTIWEGNLNEMRTSPYGDITV